MGHGHSTAWPPRVRRGRAARWLAHPAADAIGYAHCPPVVCDEVPILPALQYFVGVGQHEGACRECQGCRTAQPQRRSDTHSAAVLVANYSTGRGPLHRHTHCYRGNRSPPAALGRVHSGPLPATQGGALNQQTPVTASCVVQRDPVQRRFAATLGAAQTGPTWCSASCRRQLLCCHEKCWEGLTQHPQQREMQPTLHRSPCSSPQPVSPHGGLSLPMRSARTAGRHASWSQAPRAIAPQGSGYSRGLHALQWAGQACAH